tara:strand:- start:4177 stop:4863 length:687 start_codon:yes stop_codon:yes gene_type:complete
LSSTGQKAYGAIREAIINGVYAPATRLREEHLAETIGVSRTPIRDALKRLALEKLVTLEPNQGAFVASWSAQDLEDIFKIRSLVECEAAGLATLRLSRQEIDVLRDLADQMCELYRAQSKGFLDEIAKLNHKFHRLIIYAAGNERISQVLEQAIEMPVVHQTFRRYDNEELLRSLGHHRELVAAFTARDEKWATAVMLCHILSAKHVLLSAIDKSKQPVPNSLSSGHI